MQLKFLLVDGTTFHAKGVVHNYSSFYQDQMKSLRKMKDELPEVYKAYKKFINNSVFGEGEEEIVGPGERKERKFAEQFDADFAVVKAKEQKGKDVVDPRGKTPDPATPMGRSEGDDN